MNPQQYPQNNPQPNGQGYQQQAPQGAPQKPAGKKRAPRPPFVGLEGALIVLAVFGALALAIGIVGVLNAAPDGPITSMSGLAMLVASQFGRVLIFIARKVDTLATGQQW